MSTENSGNFRPLSRERAEELKKALERAKHTTAGLAIDKENGTIISSASIDEANEDKRNIIGKFDTHYVSY